MGRFNYSGNTVGSNNVNVINLKGVFTSGGYDESEINALIDARLKTNNVKGWDMDLNPDSETFGMIVTWPERHVYSFDELYNGWEEL